MNLAMLRKTSLRPKSALDQAAIDTEQGHPEFIPTGPLRRKLAKR